MSSLDRIVKTSLLVFIGLFFVAVVLSIGYQIGSRLGGSEEVEVVEEEFVDPWDQDIPTPELVAGYLDQPPEDFRYYTEGSLDGFVVFGVSSDEGLVSVKVDGSGKVVWAYRFENKGLLTDVRQLDSGNFLIQNSRNGVYEVSKEGNLVWYVLDGTSSHHAQRLPNGNTVITETERSRAYEVTSSKVLVWEWDARSEIPQLDKSTYVGYQDLEDSDPISSAYADYRELMHGRKDWTHINTAFRTTEGTTLLSLRNLDLILEVDPSNNVVWSFGPLVLKHPHTPTRLENGNTLIFDNGNGRVVEVTPDHRIVWEYGGLYSPTMGGSQRLPDGTTLICESARGFLLVVGSKGETIWKLVVTKDSSAWGLVDAKNTGIYRAWWYPN